MYARKVSVSVRIWKHFLGLLFIILLFQGGCGGPKHEPSLEGGKVQIQIAWPERPKPPSRYIPPYAQSLYFEMYRKDGIGDRYRLYANRPDDRPTVQTVSYDRLIPAGRYILACVARTGRDGQGDTVAAGAVEFDVLAGQTFNVEITLQSTIQMLKIIPESVVLRRGSQLQLSIQAIDGAGRVLLIPNESLTWEVISGSEHVSLSSSGLLVANSVGSARIRVSETGAGVTAETEVDVQPEPSRRLLWVCTSRSILGFVDLDNGTFTQVGHTRTTSGRSIELEDIAWLRPANRLYGVSGSTLYNVDPTSGTLTEVGRLPRPVVGLTASNTHLYAAGSDRIYEIDPDNFSIIREMRFTGGTVAGDLDADASGQFYITTSSRTLIRFDADSGESFTVGSTSPYRFFAVAFVSGILYGCSTDDKLVSIDTANANVTVVFELSVDGTVKGASAQ